MKELEINSFDYSEEEVWKPVKGFEDSYEISSLGNIRSCTRLIRATTRPCLLKGQALKPKLDKYGYLHIGLYRYQKGKWFTLHRLVAIAFILNPKNKPCVNHINGIKTDNRVENLEWCTVLENNQHATITGLRDGVVRKGEKSNFSKLKQVEVDEIRRDYNKKTCNLECLAKRYNSSISNISQILNNITWQR